MSDDTIPLKFIRRGELEKIHADTIQRYGGKDGVLDESGADSARCAPHNVFLYAEGLENEYELFATLAATYWVHLALAHAYADGNKRIGFASAMVFLYMNGYEADMTQDEAYVLTMSIATREVDRDYVAAILKTCLRRIPKQIT